jgi:hypothetical protein
MKGLPAAGPSSAGSSLATTVAWNAGVNRVAANLYADAHKNFSQLENTTESGVDASGSNSAPGQPIPVMAQATPSMTNQDEQPSASV